MTKKELREHILEFLRIEFPSFNDDAIKSLSRTITNLCSNDITIDPDRSETAEILDRLSANLLAVANDLRYNDKL